MIISVGLGEECYEFIFLNNLFQKILENLFYPLVLQERNIVHWTVDVLKIIKKFHILFSETKSAYFQKVKISPIYQTHHALLKTSVFSDSQKIPQCVGSLLLSLILERARYDDKGL